jgi:hypothetical protein
MANSKLNGERYRYASIDTAPGADGYWSDAVSMSSVNAGALFFSRSGAGVGTVTIQYKLPHTGSAWTDYDDPVTLTDGVRCRLDDTGAGVKWRAGVKNGNYTSDTIIVGFDW